MLVSAERCNERMAGSMRVVQWRPDLSLSCHQKHIQCSLRSAKKLKNHFNTFDWLEQLWIGHQPKWTSGGVDGALEESLRVDVSALCGVQRSLKSIFTRLA